LKDTKLLEAQPNDDFFRGLMEQLEKGPPIGSKPTERPKRNVLDNGPTPTVVPTNVAPVPNPPKTKSGSSKKNAAAAAAAAVAANSDTKNNTVVKQFFRSLLNQKGGPPSSDSRGNRTKVQQYLKTGQTEENSSVGTSEDPSRSLSPTRSPNTVNDTTQG